MYFVFSGRILLLIATTAQLATAAPAWSSKEYLSSPDSYQDYLTLRDPDYKRAPWAPSMPRSDMFSQKIRELISERNKGKRSSKQSEQIIELGQLSDEDVTNLLKFLQTGIIQGLDYEAMDFAMKALNEGDKSASQPNELGKSRSSSKEYRGRGGPVVYQLDGPDGFKQQPKRSASPFNLGLGQHAANAAMSAYENILDESRNYKPERPSSPVRFLGKR